jgi:hypothetical protein
MRVLHALLTIVHLARTQAIDAGTRAFAFTVEITTHLALRRNLIDATYTLDRRIAAAILGFARAVGVISHRH